MQNFSDRTAGWLAAALLCVALSLSAQSVPRFTLPDSGLEWRNPAMPLRYFDATGRRAAVFGKQDGRFEAWIYPIKLLHGLRLEFRLDGMADALRGETLLEEIITRPESTTLVYVHAGFTVRQIIWPAHDQPAILMFFDVDSRKPLAITVRFVPDFKPMWPAALGGQHSFWIEQEKAFALTDGREQHVALIGSPAVGAFTEFTDHQLVGGEMLLQLRVTPEQARGSFVPLVMALGMAGQKQASETYRNALSHARELYEQKVAHWKQFLERTARLETPDAELNRAFAWAKVAIESGWVCHARMGCGIVAGYGPSFEGERPGFAWWFGGDALMSAWAMEDYGDATGALQALRFLRARQRADGKMMHEMTQSVDLVDWFGQYHYAYYHADTTPMYLYSLAEHWRRTADHKFLEEFWDSAKRAYVYCLSTVDPADGLMDNAKAGLAAVEVGPLRGKVVKDIYLEGFWIGGLQAMAEMSAEMGDQRLANDAKAHLAAALKSLQTQWWTPEGKRFAFGVTAERTRADMLGNWPSVLLALAPEMDEAKARAEAEALSTPELATDWGDRWLSNKDPFYDPVSYNNGTVWPFMNTFVSRAQYGYGNALAAFLSWSDTARLTGIQAPGYMPEHMNGYRYLAGERSVPHQLFSSVGVVVPAIHGLLGVDVHGDVVTFSPQLPANWDSVAFSNIATGGGRLSGAVRRRPGVMELAFDYAGDGPLTIEPRALPPLGARLQAWRVSDGNWKREEKDGHLVSVRLPRAAHGMITYEYSGGIAIVPPAADPQPGDRVSGLKVIRAAENGDHQIDMTVAGLGGHTYVLELITTSPSLQSDATISKTPAGYRLSISFEGSDYVTREIHLRY